jgi:hypothetical protein
MNLLAMQQMGFAELMRQNQPQGAPPPRRASDILDPDFLPKQALTKLRNVDVEFDTLNATITSQPAGQVSPQFLQAWSAQLADWKSFKTASEKELTSPFVIPNVDAISAETDRYREKLIGWDRSFREQNPNAPVIGPIPQPPKAPEPFTPTWLKVALGAAVLGGVAYVGYSIYSFVKGGSTVLRLVKRVSHDDPYEVYEGGKLMTRAPRLDPRLLQPYPRSFTRGSYHGGEGDR